MGAIRAFITATAAGLLTAPCLAQAPAGAQAAAMDLVKEPAALEALQQMSGYLRSLKSFTVKSDITFEEVLTNGQKLQYAGILEVMAAPPTRLRINEISDRQYRQFFYDGRNLTVFAPRLGYYATLDAPASIGEMISSLDEKHGVEIPLADLFTFGSDPKMLDKIQSAFVVGSEVIDGDLCDHYAFRQQNVDWQIWIRRGSEPLPRKFVITTTSDEARPEYEARLAWTLNPAHPANLFAYAPSPQDRRIAMASAAAGGAGGDR